MRRGRFRPRSAARWIRIESEHGSTVQAIGVRDPSDSTRRHSRDAEGNVVMLAKFGSAVVEQFQQRAIDVAESEEAEIVGADGDLTGAKAQIISRFPRGAEAPLCHGATRSG